MDRKLYPKNNIIIGFTDDLYLVNITTGSKAVTVWPIT